MSLRRATRALSVMTKVSHRLIPRRALSLGEIKPCNEKESKSSHDTKDILTNWQELPAWGKRLLIVYGIGVIVDTCYSSYNDTVQALLQHRAQAHRNDNYRIMRNKNKSIEEQERAPTESERDAAERRCVYDAATSSVITRCFIGAFWPVTLPSSAIAPLVLYKYAKPKSGVETQAKGGE